MSGKLALRKRLDFSQLPNDWKVSRIAVNWEGQPLVLVEEGKPLFPSHDTSIETRIKWLNRPPKARHLIHWDGSSECTLTLEKSTGIFSCHIQPLGEGWLLCEARGGRAYVYDRAGRLQNTLDLGDASQDVQTTPSGKIWVSYFDEGVYGGGIGSQHGVVCFDSSGHPIFKYFDFAQQNGLPLIDDCYAMNVVSEDEVWLCYYSDFPLVSIKNFRLHKFWKDFGCMDRAFAVLADAVLFPMCYTLSKGENSQVLRRTLSQSPQTEQLETTDAEGRPIAGQFRAAARGSHFFVWTETALHES